MKPLSVSVSKTCQLTGLGRTSVYALLNDDKLVAFKIGRRTLISFESIEALLKQQRFNDR